MYFPSMPGHLLYSTNPLLKFLIHRQYRGDVHYVWCSEKFDSRMLPRYTIGSLVPPTSNPADIYRELADAVAKNDRHNLKIAEQKASLAALAVDWHNGGLITDREKEEIQYMVANAEFNFWRPIVYVIPRAIIGGRLKPVPPDKRAGLGEEFIIEDLRGDEFDLIEV